MAPDEVYAFRIRSRFIGLCTLSVYQASPWGMVCAADTWTPLPGTRKDSRVVEVALPTSPAIF